MRKKYSTSIQVKEKPVVVMVHLERRRDVRFGINRSGVNLRLPAQIATLEMHAQLKKLEHWVNEVVDSKPEIQKLIFGTGKSYQSGDILTVGNRKYTLHIVREDRETHSARLVNEQIFLTLSQKSTEQQTEKAIKHLLSRVVAGDFRAEITRRVLDLNRKHFQQPIRSVNLKYNLSNWGSCSANNNVNLSTRLLFAPPDVQDYVIIHELAHLIEMNHSDRFWALVARAMPDYREKEMWLKQHGKSCDF